MRLESIILGLALISFLHAQEIDKIALPLPKDMQRADIFVLKPTWPVDAILVLCPGQNGSGEGMIRQPEWQKFAEVHRLGLIGLSFASDARLLQDGRGYFYASLGSGQVLLDGLRQEYNRDLPLLLFGFSGGAQFVSRFEEWKPERVISWCADSAAWWVEPSKAAAASPGIVACGEEDPFYGATLIYFKKGRAAGKPWLWVGVPGLGHATTPSVESFARDYFDAVLRSWEPKVEDLGGVWIDIDSGEQVNVAGTPPSLTGWLPDPNLLNAWKKICIP